MVQYSQHETCSVAHKGIHFIWCIKMVNGVARRTHKYGEKYPCTTIVDTHPAPTCSTTPRTTRGLTAATSSRSKHIIYAADLQKTMPVVQGIRCVTDARSPPAAGSRDAERRPAHIRIYYENVCCVRCSRMLRRRGLVDGHRCTRLEHAVTSCCTCCSGGMVKSVPPACALLATAPGCRQFSRGQDKLVVAGRRMPAALPFVDSDKAANLKQLTAPGLLCTPTCDPPPLL